MKTMSKLAIALLLSSLAASAFATNGGNGADGYRKLQQQQTQTQTQGSGY